MTERFNNRKNDELRNIKITKDYTKHALGSVLIEFGDTKVIVTASVDESKPKWMDKTDTRGWVTAEYSLLPSATHTRCQRERNKISGRTQEIQRLIGRSLRSCVNLEKLGERTITIDADVIQADGGTRRIKDHALWRRLGGILQALRQKRGYGMVQRDRSL